MSSTQGSTDRVPAANRLRQADQAARRRWSHLYTLLTGVIGLLLLVQIFDREATSANLATLLLFTLAAVVASYFRVPIGGAELSLDGAILLGATLAGGPVFGGWAAFITGLAAPMGGTDTFLPPATPRTLIKRVLDSRWVNRASSSLLTSGRNVIAIKAAWLAYQGLGGPLAPTTIDAALILALAILYVVHCVVRCLWEWPVTVLQSASPQQEVANLIYPATILAELLPLPIAPLISATFVQLGWVFFVLLVFLFIGLGAVMRQMIRTIHAMREEIEAHVLANRVRQAIATTAPQIGALIELAHKLVCELIDPAYFELGLYISREKGARPPEGEEEEAPQVEIHAVTLDGDPLPPMCIPVTPLWAWLSERNEPLLAQDKIDLAQLPFSLPPMQPGKEPQTALLVPLQANSTSEPDRPPSAPIGGLVLQSTRAGAISASHLKLIALIARHVGPALAQARR